MEASPPLEETADTEQIVEAERSFIAAREEWHRENDVWVRQAQEQQDA